jgi:hypothetical protein
MQVLRPSSDIFCLKIWSYYTAEYLACGPSYDIELVTRDVQDGDSSSDSGDTVTSSASGPNTRNQVISGCYDDPHAGDGNGFTAIIQVG